MLHPISEFENKGNQSFGLAIDVGCGIGNDSMELLRRGWSGLVIDRQPIALERLSKRVSKIKKYTILDSKSRYRV